MQGEICVHVTDKNIIFKCSGVVEKSSVVDGINLNTKLWLIIFHFKYDFPVFKPNLKSLFLNHLLFSVKMTKFSQPDWTPLASHSILSSKRCLCLLAVFSVSPAQGSFRGHLAASPQQPSARRRTNENAVVHFFRSLVSLVVNHTFLI